jgi:hypothetical protein
MDDGCLPLANYDGSKSNQGLTRNIQHIPRSITSGAVISSRCSCGRKIDAKLLDALFDMDHSHSMAICDDGSLGRLTSQVRQRKHPIFKNDL